MFLVVTGGSGSGKSEYAEKWLVNRGAENRKRYYIATMMPFGEEEKEKVKRHQSQRKDRNFLTIEQYTELSAIEISQGADVLLDCMSNLVANEMYSEKGSHELVEESVEKGIDFLLKKVENLVVVTNEVFSDGITYDTETEKYMRHLGRINQMLAQKADMVIEVVYSIPVYLKGEERI